MWMSPVNVCQCRKIIWDFQCKHLKCSMLINLLFMWRLFIYCICSYSVKESSLKHCTQKFILEKECIVCMSFVKRKYIKSE